MPVEIGEAPEQRAIVEGGDVGQFWQADAPTWEALKQTEFPELQHELNVLPGRREPWLTEIFDTADESTPPDWVLNTAERSQAWRDAKQVLTALEQADAY